MAADRFTIEPVGTHVLPASLRTGFAARQAAYNPQVEITVAALSLLLALTAATAVWCALGWRRSAHDVERLRSLARWRADQVSMLSHELRTPLTMVKLSGDILAGEDPGPLTSAQSGFVETIRHQADSTIELAEDMLTQARIEAGRFSVHLQPCDVAEIVVGLVADLRGLRGSHIVMDCPTVPCWVQADQLLVRQALANLINNAVTVSPSGSPVTVQVAQREFDVLVSVTDQGTGMTAKERLELFQRFSSGRPLRSGTGLGLVITKQIVERHGGQLFVDTVAARGTTMMFNLPISGPAGLVVG